MSIIDRIKRMKLKLCKNYIYILKIMFLKFLGPIYNNNKN